MLTRLIVRNFKALESVDISLGQNVVFVGPNNSGKTSALQALALWQSGLREWSARRRGSTTAKQRVGVTVNRRSLTHTPVAEARQLWRELKVNVVRKTRGSQDTQPIFLDVIVEGETAGEVWQCGLEFYYANPESIYCRPLRVEGGTEQDRMPIPDQALDMKIAMLPPMSGLATEEPEVQAGRIAVLLGEGQTAQVLRNLCFQVYASSPENWQEIVGYVSKMFGVTLGIPTRDPARGTVELSYEQRGITLDLPSSGRGLQQTLLLLTHLYSNRGAVLLLDEPDAHLEILRQREIYSLLTDVARKSSSQVIAASHSEVVLNEAGDRDVVIAFVGAPHRIDDRGNQLLKSLREIGFDQYYQAELKGFVLYLEGATDLAILRALAQVLNHPAQDILLDPFVVYVQNHPKKVEHHFYGVREAKKDLIAFSLFDRLDIDIPDSFRNIEFHQWKKREIENYISKKDVLLRYAEGHEVDDLVGRAMRAARREAMENAIERVEGALRDLDKDPWSDDIKVSDEFLVPLFKRFFEELKLDNRLNKSDFHLLADFLDKSEIDEEVRGVLDAIVACANRVNSVVT